MDKPICPVLSPSSLIAQKPRLLSIDLTCGDWKHKDPPQSVSCYLSVSHLLSCQLSSLSFYNSNLEPAQSPLL